MDELFSDAAAKLATYPMLGRLGKVPGTRELIPHENYLVIFMRSSRRQYGYWHWFMQPVNGLRSAIESISQWIKM